MSEIPTVRLYSADGGEISVNADLAANFEQFGWSRTPPVKPKRAPLKAVHKNDHENGDD